MIRAVSASIVALGLALASIPTGAQVPEEFTNLRLINPEIERDDLINIMRDWTAALGVRCNHCHVEPDNLIGADFASDDKASKRTARKMLEMARVINRELLQDLPSVEEGETHQPTACYTCHRGQPQPPRNLATLLASVDTTHNLRTALREFRKLHAEHYGTGRYDFSDQTLNRFAGRLLELGRAEDAVTVMETNLEFYPDSTLVLVGMGRARQAAGDPEGAKESFERALEIEPDNRGAQMGLASLAQPND